MEAELLKLLDRLLVPPVAVVDGRDANAATDALREAAVDAKTVVLLGMSPDHPTWTAARTLPIAERFRARMEPTAEHPNAVLERRT